MDMISTPQFGEILEQGKQAATNAVKQTVSDTVGAAQGQIGIKDKDGKTPVTNQAQPQAQTQSQAQQPPSEATVAQDPNNNNETAEMVRDYYSPSPTITQNPKPQTQEEYETQQKLLKVRQELHDQVYYEPLFAYEHQKQERPAEVAEKIDEQKKMMELEQKKEDKKLPLAVQRAQTSVEINRGISG